MCDPITLAGIALAVGGTGTEMYAKNQEGKAMNSAANAELQRQQGYEQKGRGIFDQSLEQNTTPVANKQIAQGTQNAQNQYAGLNTGATQTPDFGTGSAGQDKVVNAQTNAKVQASGNAMAPMQGYGDWQTMQAINNLKANSALGQNASNARNSQNVLPTELMQAQDSQSGLAGVGSLMSTAGGLMSLYGAVNPSSVATNTANAFPSAATAAGYRVPFNQMWMNPTVTGSNMFSTIPPYGRF